ncbi:hypothetical protein [Tsukamurella hominis]|uniref:hypothetical protein n=1 Tax=Tsukamurella hominis TaxID=1970232 RepID=UPI0039E88CDD
MTSESGKTRRVEMWDNRAFAVDAAGYVNIFRDGEKYFTEPVPGWITQEWTETYVSYVSADGFPKSYVDRPDRPGIIRVIAACVDEGGQLEPVNDRTDFVDTVYSAQADRYIASMERHTARRAGETQ